MPDAHPAPTARAVLPIALLAIVAACSAPAGAPGDTPSDRPVRTGPVVATVPAETAAVVGEVPDEIMAAVLADAADRGAVAADEIDVVSAAAVTFSDGSLDCPEPGMAYTQALVDGYQVVLDAAGTQLDYRITSTGSFRLCEEGGPPAGG